MTHLQEAQAVLRDTGGGYPAVLTPEQAKAVQHALEAAERAPHDQWCDMPPRWPDYKDVACTCWKSTL